MNTNRILAGVLACTAFALSFYAYQDLRFLGFPDGSLDDWGRMRKPLLSLFVGVSGLVGLWSFFLVRLSGRAPIKTKLRITGILYALFVVLMFLLDARLDQLSGRGG